MSLRGLLLGLTCLAPLPAMALTLEFPALSTEVADKDEPFATYFLPLAPYGEEEFEGVVAEGAVRQKSWRVGAGGLTTMQILAPLRDQLAAAGYEPLFECADRVCGGFDFRFNIDVLPEPDMHVNLGDFRYLAARKDGAMPEYAALVVSRSDNAGFVQLTRIGAPDATAITTSTKTPVVPIIETGAVGEMLRGNGHATLDDLVFKTGSSELGDAEFASLADLAEFLRANPSLRVVLVGHTDAEGALQTNIALSRKRASAVVSRLIERHGVDAAQVSADGVGYLAPRASNLTPEGRTQNRRVEVILTSTQ